MPSKLVCPLILACSLALPGLSCSSPPEESSSAVEIAIVETTTGEFAIHFFPDKAPRTVENFKRLAREGFYNGTYFHRVVPDLLVQGGDPNTKDLDRSNDGQGGPGYTIPEEFNDIRHVPGTVSMIRGISEDSNGSQFFVCMGTVPQMNGKYTSFGKVIWGLGTLQLIVEASADDRRNPLEPIYIERIRFEEIQ